jgi:hypothetical protein
MIEELKPCPFCSAPIPYPDWIFWYPGVPNFIKLLYLRYYGVAYECPLCESVGPRRATFQEAKEAWNTRADPQEIPDWLVDAINTRRFELEKQFNGNRLSPAYLKAEELIEVLILKPEVRK